MKFLAIFIISSQETAEREWLDAAVRDEGIATAISEERNAADDHSQPGRLPDQIMKVAKFSRNFFSIPHSAGWSEKN